MEMMDSLRSEEKYKVGYFMIIAPTPLLSISDHWPLSLQLIKDGDIVQASTSVDPVTEADVGKSVVETVVSIMPQVVPTAGSEVEPTEIPAIADQQLMQAQATTEAADQEIIETQAAVRDSSDLDQGGEVVSQDTGGSSQLIFNNYLLNWIWLVLDIYRDTKR